MQTTFSRSSARKLALILIAVLPALLVAVAMLALLAATVAAHEPGYEEKAWSLQAEVTVDGTINSGEWTTDTSKIVVSGLTGQVEDLNLRLKQDGSTGGANLYIALSKGSLGNNNSRVTFYFDTDHDNGTAPDADDVAVQLEYSAAGIQTTSYFEGNGTQWVAHSSPPTWTFSRNGDSLESSIPLADIGLTSDGNIAGFGVMTCDSNNKRTVGWPGYLPKKLDSVVL